MIGREKRVLLRHYLEQGMPKAEIARLLEISRRTEYNWIEAGELDRGADSKAVKVRTQATAAIEARPLQGHHRRAPGRVSEAERRASVQRGAGGGLWGRLRAGGSATSAGQLDRELDDGAVRYGPRRSRPSKLDPYRGIIDTRLAEYPELSAVRLFNEVQAAGYPGATVR